MLSFFSSLLMLLFMRLLFEAGESWSMKLLKFMFVVLSDTFCSIDECQYGLQGKHYSCRYMGNRLCQWQIVEVAESVVV